MDIIKFIFSISFCVITDHPNRPTHSIPINAQRTQNTNKQIKVCYGVIRQNESKHFMIFMVCLSRDCMLHHNFIPADHQNNFTQCGNHMTHIVNLTFTTESNDLRRRKMTASDIQVVCPQRSTLNSRNIDIQ